MTDNTPNQDINYQPKTQGFSFRNKHSNNKNGVKTLFALTLSILGFSVIFIILILLLNSAKIINLFPKNQNSPLPTSQNSPLPKNHQSNNESVKDPPKSKYVTITILNPVFIPIKNSTGYKSSVYIDTGVNNIDSVDLELSYDPKLLQFVEIVPFSFFNNPTVNVKKIDEKLGKISLNLTQNKEKSGTGIIAVLSFSLTSEAKNGMPLNILSESKVKNGNKEIIPLQNSLKLSLPISTTNSSASSLLAP